ncbi:MAG: ribonuclease H-like domain-containing protein [Alphaproteobacteria bacterium]|nr:ribonuclease H-like domain-containing protein [Alphaproteobacteria bacterium]
MNLFKNDLPEGISFKNSVAIDTETMGLAIKRDRLCLVQMCSEDGHTFLVQIQKGMQDRAYNLKKMLTDESILKIFHYARFDVAILNYTFGINVRPIYCTKVASKLARTYTDKHGLKNLCKDILGIELSKHEQSSDWGADELLQEQLKYAEGDVLYLHKLREKLNAMLVREGKMELANKCFETIGTITDLELAGITPEELFAH